MDSTIIIAVISLIGTSVGTVGGIIASGKLTNYRIEQLEKKMDAHNSFMARIPVVEEKIHNMDHRIQIIEKGDKRYENFKINNNKNNYAGNCNYQPYT